MVCVIWCWNRIVLLSTVQLKSYHVLLPLIVSVAAVRKVTIPVPPLNVPPTLFQRVPFIVMPNVPGFKIPFKVSVLLIVMLAWSVTTPVALTART